MAYLYMAHRKEKRSCAREKDLMKERPTHKSMARIQGPHQILEILRPSNLGSPEQEAAIAAKRTIRAMEQVRREIIKKTNNA
jgi:hypothetical protein